MKWKGKKIPELPLLQPEKVSEMPLALTFDDAYRYTLAGEDTVQGIPCWALDFTPRVAAGDKPLYAGTVWVAKSDFAAIRTRTRQLNLSAELQAVDEVSDFGEVPAGDGGPPLRLPTHVTGQWILKTFSRTTVIERESTLSEVRLDPPRIRRRARGGLRIARTSMVRDTEKGVRYLEKTKEGGRVVTEDAKRSHLFGARRRLLRQLLRLPASRSSGSITSTSTSGSRRNRSRSSSAASSSPRPTTGRASSARAVDAGIDVFGIAIRGTDAVFVDGTEDKTQRVKSRSFAAAFKAGVPLAPPPQVHGDRSARRTATSRPTTPRRRRLSSFRRTTGSRGSRVRPCGT